ncbi:MAG: MoxR family ATPase [Phycisphaeraceae bacterium]
MTDLSPDVALNSDDVRAIEQLSAARQTVRDELAKVIVGQDAVIDQLLISIFSQGHCLLEGVPGLAKTLMVSTLASSFDMSFSRIQFTPDLMPSDITGTEVIQEDKSTGSRAFRFLRGPVFANVVLADEINRTPPKTQAAMLEAMQERKITIGGTNHALPKPFFVLATQNPIEQEGTYPLPEAQQDRFMFKVFVKYPSYEEEYAIAERTTTRPQADVSPVLSAEQVLRLQELVRRVPAAPRVIHYALKLVRATRVSEGGVPAFVNEWISWGAGPRAVQYLILGGKARAALSGRPYVSTEDIRAVAHPVLRHRVITNFNAESEGVTTDHVVDRLLKEISDNETGEALGPDVARAIAK